MALSYVSTFPGRADQVGLVRREIAAYLDNCPAADDMILIASELKASAELRRPAPWTGHHSGTHRPRRVGHPGNRNRSTRWLGTAVVVKLGTGHADPGAGRLPGRRQRPRERAVTGV